MANPVIFLYENALGGLVVFRRGGDCIISDMTSVSSVDTQISEAQGVGQTGATATAASIQPRTLTVNGAVRSPAARAALLAAVLPGVSARLTMLAGGERRYLEGIPSKSPDIANNRGVQKFQFSFRCSYPFWRGEDIATTLAALAPKFSFPCSLAGSWYISRYATSAFAVAENTGNMPAPLTVRFYARTQVIDPEIYHLESGSYIRINATMEIGDEITVSTVYGQKGATRTRPGGEPENVFRLLDIGSDLSMQLRPGTNTYKYDAADGKSGLDVTILAPKGVWAGV